MTKKNETKKNTTTTLENDALYYRALKLKLYGVTANWERFANEPWLPTLLEYEERERKQRSLERRFKDARIGAFKPLADFEWKHPKKIDRRLIDDLFTFDFFAESANVIILGPNGVGKTMIAKNLAHQAIARGKTVRFTSASQMLNELASQDSASLLSKRLRKYAAPDLLVLDEVGYLSYDSRYADLLFEVITRRYEQNAPVVVTTNRPFSEWNDIFPNASCVVTLVDRLCHRAEIVHIDGPSFRLKEAKDRAHKRKNRTTKKSD